MNVLSPSPLRLDANQPLQSIYAPPETPAILRQSLNGALTWQIRNETTAQKAILSPNLAPQFIAALLALNAEIISGADKIPLAAYLDRTQPAQAHILALQLPPMPSGFVWGEAHVSRTPADEPIVAAWAVLNLDGNTVQAARLALTGAQRQHARLAQAAERLIGHSLNDELIQQVADAAAQEANPPNDYLGGSAYRRRMVAVLTRRALEKCRNEERTA